MDSIPVYHEINELHRLTGATVRTDNPLFHCFDMGESNNLAVNAVPPHRASFYTLALNFGTQNLSYTLNERHFHHPHNFVLCTAPGHVATWKKQGDWFGYCTFFKSEFLLLNDQVNFLQQFPFFRINESNLLPIEGVEFDRLRGVFRQIIAEQSHADVFSTEVIRSLFQGVLWQVRRLYEQTNTVASPRVGAAITARFQWLLNEQFLEKITVAEYAELLYVSANHLSQTVKQTTGYTAKHLINERRLLEAQHLLTYTHNSVAGISHHLRFSEPTHFTKFFKKHTGETPLTYRSRKSQR